MAKVRQWWPWWDLSLGIMPYAFQDDKGILKPIRYFKAFEKNVLVLKTDEGQTRRRSVL